MSDARGRGRVHDGCDASRDEARCARSPLAPHPSPCCSRDRGFTLLEILIVLALMAIVAGFVMPMFGGPISTSELRASARQLAAGLRLAQSEAVAQRRETFLVLDVAGKRFKVDNDPHEHRLPSKIELKLFTAQNDLVSESVGSIRFFPDGGSNGGRITVASGERKFDVDIDWLTGRVAILQ
jgi:general secretion pathway protein H